MDYAARRSNDRGDGSVRVLAIHRYFWPDAPPYASILRAITRRWATDGHHLEVLSTQPSYKSAAQDLRRPHRELLDGVLVRRLRVLDEHGRPWARLLNILRLCFSVARLILVGRRYDVVMASTAPPVVLAWVASWAARRRGGAFVYHCMDLHPEIGAISGEFSNGFVYRALQRLDQSTCRRSAAVVVLSKDMRRALVERGLDSANVRVINNFAIPSFAGTADENDEAATCDAKKDALLRLVFTGNIGRFQGLEAAVDAVADAGGTCELVLMGEGSALAALRKRVQDRGTSHVTFLPHQPPAAARRLIRSADLCLVTLQPRVILFAYPSKTMTYLSEGRPVLACVEQHSELADLLERENVGLSVPPRDAAALRRVLGELTADGQQLDGLRRAAQKVGPSLFDVESALDEWSALLANLTPSEPRP